MSASIETPGASARRPSGDRATSDFGASANISRVPYLPGLDGMRALAVVTVMIYHANSTWLKGGFLGVEVFFVISGYLITLLLIGEDEKNGHVDLRHSVPDVLASTANLLKVNGWRPGAPFGEGTENFQVMREWNRSEVYRKTMVYFAEQLPPLR